MPQLLSKAPFVGRTRKLLLSGDRDAGLEKSEVAKLELLFSGIKGDFHAGLTPSTRLQFPSGATIVVDMENFPCHQVADVVAQHHPEPKAGLVASAMHKRGVTAWVEREGIIKGGDDIIAWVPPQRLYAHMGS